MRLPRFTGGMQQARADTARHPFTSCCDHGHARIQRVGKCGVACIQRVSKCGVACIQASRSLFPFFSFANNDTVPTHR